MAGLYAYPDGDRPWLRANMVESVDGAAAVDGRSGGLSGDADKRDLPACCAAWPTW